MSPLWFFFLRKLCNPRIAFVTDVTVEAFAFFGQRKILNLAVAIPNELSIILAREIDNQTLFIQEYGSGREKVSPYFLLAQMHRHPRIQKVAYHFQ